MSDEGGKDRKGCLIGPFASAWRGFDAAVRNAHANWIAILGWIVALLTALAVAWYSLSVGPSAEPRAAGADPLPPAEVQSGPPPVASTPEGRGGEATRCGGGYASASKVEFLDLIEAKGRRCLLMRRDPLELFYSCEVVEGVYEVTLTYQVGTSLDGKRLAFSAQYRGVPEIDLTKVNVTPLDSVSRDLCQ